MAFRAFRFSVPLAVQLALLTLLFVGSLAALVYDVLGVRAAPELERSTRRRLRQASADMAVAAASFDERQPELSSVDAWYGASGKLGQITEGVLSEYPGVEGGFYLDGKLDRFAGYAFPTDRPPRKRRPDVNEPPPLEEPYIRVQARNSLELPAGEFSVSVHDVGPSRVMIVTEPVGSKRPAIAATWVMFRLVNPRLLDRQVRRYQASTGLALVGLLLALGLTARLGINLNRERGQQAQLRDELRRSERLAALGKLLAGVAHEVRNPLAAIRSTVQLWQRLPEQSQTPESLEAVIRAVDRLNETVTQLLQFSRADGAVREPVDVHAALRETLELFAAQARQQHVEIETVFGAPMIISGSNSGLRQVFANLVRNSLDAMPQGGTLYVATRQQATKLMIEFTDSGEGIPPEIAAHLFEPFFTTRPQGTGLGLAICREIIVQHGGKIELAASADKGAKFRIELPSGE